MKLTLLKLIATGALAYSVAACGTKEKAADTAATSTAAAPESPVAESSATTPATSDTESAPTATTPAAEAATFDISSVPVSTADLGKFPYIGGLKGYHVRYDSDSIDYEFDNSYVYDGKNLIGVEGHVLRRTYYPIDTKKQASDLMVRRNYENWVKSVGGVKVFSGLIPKEAIKEVGGENNALKGGLSNYVAISEYDMYVIRQKDKEVWVQVQKPTDTYYLNVMERAAMPQQVTVVKADELKKN